MVEKEQRGSSLFIKHAEMFDINNEVEVPLQTNLDKYTKGTGNLGNPTTKITLVNKTKLCNYYTVEQFSPTIKESIRFYFNGLQDFSRGFQRKTKFSVIYRKFDSKVFICTNIWHTEIFLRRIKELEKSIVLRDAHFNFEDFSKIPEIKNIWGVWEKVNLPHIQTTWSGGNQVEKSIQVKLSRATCVNLKLEDDGNIYALTF